jgi:2-furoyl-CoA dehydrogenase large subunit
LAIAAPDLGIPIERAVYSEGNVFDKDAPQSRRTWTELVINAHRHFHLLPPGLAGPVGEPCEASPQGERCRADGRVQMYPCFSFELHLVLMAIDPDLGKPEIRRYFVGHDCGTVINPKISVA